MEDKVGVGAGVKTCNTAGVGVMVILPLVGALPASSSLPPRGRLRQKLLRVCGPAIVGKVRTFFFK